MGVFSGTLYEREQDGELVYSTRKLPASRVYLKFIVHTPPGEQAHADLGRVGKPQLDRHAKLFLAAAQATGVDDTWLTANDAAESAFHGHAVSIRGAAGVVPLLTWGARHEAATKHASPGQSS